MGMNGETIKLAELCVKAENLLWSLGYKKSTIIHCKTAWREFLVYSLQRGQEYYDDELATSYLKEKYNYPDLTQAAHSPRVNGRASSIRKLSDLYHPRLYTWGVSVHGLLPKKEPCRRYTIPTQKEVELLF